MTQIHNSLMEILRDTHALLNGHFRLSSGLHSDQYLQCARLLQHPRHARFIGEKFAEVFSDIPVDAVIAPAIGGIIVAHEAGSAIGVRAIFGERMDGEMQLRRGFEINPGDRFLLVEDVITTGKSTREIIHLVESHQGKIAAIGSIADRSMDELDLPVKPRSLVRLNIESWTSDKCPLCRAGQPLTSPGSRHRA